LLVKLLDIYKAPASCVYLKSVTNIDIMWKLIFSG